MSITKTLQKHGNSSALIIDKSMLEAMGATTDTPLQITLNGNSLTITPINKVISREEIAASLVKLRPRYGQMLKNLAK